MKKFIIYLFIGLFLIGSLASCGSTKVNIEDNSKELLSNKIENEKHLILNNDGSYGGTLNSSRYGKGAPLNGEYDVKDSIYYSINDYYNMLSTKERLIYPNFKGYQQTMKDSSGLACAVAMLNYFGEDISVYSELELLKRYEELNNSVVYQNGTTPEGLRKLFNNLGYGAQINNYEIKGSSRQEYVGAFKEWVLSNLSNGLMALVRYQDNMDNRWRLIIGYDTMGTDEWNTDDIVIFMDPYDGFDHYQDGYSIEAAGRFERWWKSVELSGVVSSQLECVVVTPKEQIKIETVESDPNEIIPSNIPEIHLILNKDGSYGGTTDSVKYGDGTPLNGKYDHTNRNYWVFNDYYNLGNTDTRYLLTNYRAMQQTMASSCGICSTLSALNYYGEDVIDLYNEIWLVNKYEELTGKTVKGSGVGGSGLEDVIESIGYAATYDSFARDSYKDEFDLCFGSYDVFTNFITMNLSKGTPMPISWRPHGGHWEVIIGYDNMGTDYIYDDVIILADSGDSWDHYQDGYNTLPATLFFRQWYNGSYTYNQQYVYFTNTK